MQRAVERPGDFEIRRLRGDGFDQQVEFGWNLGGLTERQQVGDFDQAQCNLRLRRNLRIGEQGRNPLAAFSETARKSSLRRLMKEQVSAKAARLLR